MHSIKQRPQSSAQSQVAIICGVGNPTTDGLKTIAVYITNFKTFLLIIWTLDTVRTGTWGRPMIYTFSRSPHELTYVEFGMPRGVPCRGTIAPRVGTPDNNDAVVVDPSASSEGDIISPFSSDVVYVSRTKRGIIFALSLL